MDLPRPGGFLPRRGIRNEIWAIIICLVIGAIVGMVITPFYGNTGLHSGWASTALDSSEIVSRGKATGLIVGVFTAIPSGIGVAVAITGGGVSALIGVAISASLLPPLVNSGLCSVFGFFKLASGQKSGMRYVEYGAISFALFIVNLVLIFVTAYAMFKVKKVTHWQEAADSKESTLLDSDYLPYGNALEAGAASGSTPPAGEAGVMALPTSTDADADEAGVDGAASNPADAAQADDVDIEAVDVATEAVKED